MSKVEEKILEELDGEHLVSGVELADRLEVSRVAIWKHIQSLKKQGYSILAKPGKGYELVGAPRALLPYEIKRGLETEFVGGDVLYYEELDSTQSKAKDLAVEGKKEGTLVVAEAQTGGRGRRGRDWHSPRGGVYLSLILKPDMPPARSTLMSLLGGISVAESIYELFGLKPDLKWPNDVQIGGKKAGGILVNTSGEADVIDWIVIGIGLNANVDFSSFPSNLRKTATSLQRELGRRISRVNLTKRLLEKIEKNYQFFLREGGGPILEKWEALTNTLGVQVRVTNGEEVEGKAINIDKDGRLVIKLSDGGCKKIASGDVSLVDE